MRRRCLSLFIAIGVESFRWWSLDRVEAREENVRNEANNNDLDDEDEDDKKDLTTTPLSSLVVPSSFKGLGTSSVRDIDHPKNQRLAYVCARKDECAMQEENVLQNNLDHLYPNAFEGMILQVFGAAQETMEKTPNDSLNEWNNEATLLAMEDVSATSSSASQSTEFVMEQAYFLEEPLQLDLGTVPKHYLDFAYTPAVVTRETNQDFLEGRDEEVVPMQDDEDPTCKVVVTSSNKAEDQMFASSSKWWWWWFPLASNWWKTHGAGERDFDKGKTAFAGGSHGEVWKGRRICTKAAAFVPRHRPSHRGGRSNRESPRPSTGDCDDTQPLVLKRLRVARGYRFLEAGLREVYFANLIQEQMAAFQKEQYTVYVDHFYREVPRAFGRMQTKDLELWIVFEDAGPSIRSYMYTATASASFVMYQHSKLWTQLRTVVDERTEQGCEDVSFGSSVLLSSNATNSEEGSERKSKEQSLKVSHVGREVMRSVLHQILSAAAGLHEKGVVHRDIKPSNVMCKIDQPLTDLFALTKVPHIHCRLGDFSSGWDGYTDRHLYTKGPSPGEQTDEYAPPESYLGPNWIPFDKDNPQSYDSWSIGVLALELLLGTPNVFSIDQRTNVLLTNRMRRGGASDDEIAHALYLAALSQFCIYVPSKNEAKGLNWPLRDGDPLHRAEMVKESCTLQDFHHALRARDPLGIGFDSSTDLLLHLIWQLLAFLPADRMTAKDALDHPYFNSPSGTGDLLFPSLYNALESQMLDPRMDFNVEDGIQNFTCPKCGRVFSDWRSCQKHANSRRHARFCTYSALNLPTCINTHSLLPPHPTSGYCDIQGRRPTIEDFHSIHLYPDHQFYAVMDGHTTNFAAKWLASELYQELMARLPSLGRVTIRDFEQENSNRESSSTASSGWKDEIKENVTLAFIALHERFLEAVLSAPAMEAGSAPRLVQSGTTATALLVTDRLMMVASIGDSRAVMSSAARRKATHGLDSRYDDGMIAQWNDFPSIPAIQLSVDHLASDPTERDLVSQRGGSIFSSAGPNGLPRVNGTLAITRSIGDADLSPVLSQEPHVVILDRSEIREWCGTTGRGNEEASDGDAMNFNLPCFAIIASDGLWDTMSNQEAVDMVVEVLLNGTKNRHNNRAISRSIISGGLYQQAAERLAVEAYVRGSSDNIGVCVVELEA